MSVYIYISLYMYIAVKGHNCGDDDRLIFEHKNENTNQFCITGMNQGSNYSVYNRKSKNYDRGRDLDTRILELLPSGNLT